MASLISLIHLHVSDWWLSEEIFRASLVSLLKLHVSVLHGITCQSDKATCPSLVVV